MSIKNNTNNKKKLFSLQNVTKYYGADLIFKDVNLTINSREKWGLMGPNGCGKSTLLKLMAGLEETSEGHIYRDSSVGWVPQIENFSGKVLEYVLADYRIMENKLREAEEALGVVTGQALEKALKEYQKIRDVYDANEGDYIPDRARSIITSLGLGSKLEATAGQLSGGERSIMTLARALLKNPELLILDEPGNHLDFKGLAWLEQFLTDYRGAVLIVSHNRYLLDRVCGRMAAIEGTSLVTYTGNYSAYRMEKLRTLVNRQADYSAQEKKLQRLETMVKNFKEYAARTADPAWGKRLKAARTRLTRETENGIDRPEMDNRKIGLAFNVESSRGNIALDLKEYSRNFGELQLYQKARMEIFCGERVALVGPNGCGKTTLIKDVVERGNWDDPDIRVGPSLNIGYLSQKQDTFNPENSIVDEFRLLGPLAVNDVFSLLAPFLFTWEDMNKKIGDLSGGEKNRLQLARLIYEKKNFLILDEPTNHLDIPSREAVEEALENFEGTLLVISHDRYFLDKIATRIVAVEELGLHSQGENFTDYWSRQGGLASSAGKVNRRASERKNSSRQTSDTEQIEKQLAALEQDKLKLEGLIATAFSRGDHKEGRKLSVKLEKLSKSLGRLYEKWEALYS